MSYLYSENDITLLKNKTDKIRDQLDTLKKEKICPTLNEQQKIVKIITDYCKEHKRKLYGGFAWNLLLINKNPLDKIYSKHHIADIDIYSPEPIKDWYNICNLLHKKGIQYVMGEEAQHKETYSVKAYRKVFCDISYVPKNIYNRIPFLEIDGLYCTHPKFITIDYLRMTTDIMSYWRIFECDDLKAFKRFYKLQKNYPLIFSSKSLDIPQPKKKVTDAFNIIHKYLSGRTTTITNGFYAYNHFCYLTGYDPVYMPYYEFISTKYKEDALDLIHILKKEFGEDQISYDEYYPFFQFTDYSVEIYFGNDIICKIYCDNNKCIQYQDVSAINFNTNNIIKSSQKIRIGSFSTILMYFLIDSIKMHVKSDNDMEKFYNLCASHCIQMRNEYFKKYKKTILDDSLFKEFKFECVGTLISPEIERMHLIERRKKGKKPIVHRYDPSDNEDKEPPKYLFTNTSGNKINKEKNLRLIDNVNDVDEDVDENEEMDENSSDKQKNDDSSDESYEITNNKYNIFVAKNKENNDKLIHFNTFSEAISYVGIMNILPGTELKTSDIVKKYYYNKYEKRDEEKYGVYLEIK